MKTSFTVVTMRSKGSGMAIVMVWRQENGMSHGSRVWVCVVWTASLALLGSASARGYTHVHSSPPHWPRLPVSTITLPLLSHLRNLPKCLMVLVLPWGDQDISLLQQETGPPSLRYWVICSVQATFIVFLSNSRKYTDTKTDKQNKDTNIIIF